MVILVPILVGPAGLLLVDPRPCFGPRAVGTHGRWTYLGTCFGPVLDPGLMGLTWPPGIETDHLSVQTSPYLTISTAEVQWGHPGMRAGEPRELDTANEVLDTEKQARWYECRYEEQ